MSDLDLNKLQELVLASHKTINDDGLILPPGYSIGSLEQAIEKYRIVPRRHRGTYSTALIAEFARYVAEHARDGSRIFVSQETLTATARINHGTEEAPEWGDHRATLTLKPTPAYRALLALCGEQTTQDGLIDYIADWSWMLTFSTTEMVAANLEDQPPTMTTAAAIAAIRSLKVQTATSTEHKASDTDRERSLFEQASVTNDPPRTMFARFATHEGLEPRTIAVRLVYRPVSPPVIKCSILWSGELEMQLANEFRESLIVELKVAAAALSDAELDLSKLLHIGTFS